MIFKVVLNGSTVIYDGNNLTGILDPHLEIEINAAGSFTFILPSGSDVINEITPFTSEIDVYEDEEMIWFGRVLNKEKVWNNQCKITCEGGLAYFNDSIQDKKTWESTRTENQEGVVYDSLVGGYFDGNGDPISNPYLASDGDVTMAMFFRDLIEWHNGQVSENMQWEVGTIAAEYAIEKIWRETNRETTSDCLQTMCLDTTGGYFITRKEYADDPTEGRIAKRYIDWLDEMPYGSTQNIEFGVNLLDVSNSINGADICTVLVPIGADELTINKVPNTGSKESPVDGCYHVYGTDTVIYAESEAVYGRVQKTKTWSDITDKESLYSKAVEYLKEQNTDIPSIECSAAELHYLDGHQGESAFRVGQLVRVISAVHGILGDYPLLKISMSLNSGAKRVTIGTPPKKELTDIVKNTSGSSSRNTSGGSSGGSGGSGGGSTYIPVKDVRLKKPGDVAFETTVKNKVSKIDLSDMVKDVKLNGVSVVTGGQALLPAYPVIPVEDVVLQGGSSLVVNKRAIIPKAHDIPSGGAYGQILYKHSNSDYDAEWGDPIIPTDIYLSETNILLTSLSDTATVGIGINNGDGAYIASSDTTVATIQVTLDSHGSPTTIVITPVSDGACTINIATNGTLGPIAFDHINVTVATEALVEANPSETATDDLVTIKIGDTVYEVSGGGSSGGSQKYTCDILFENNPLPAATTGTGTVTRSYTLSDSINKYDAVLVTSIGQYTNSDNATEGGTMLILKNDYAIGQGDWIKEINNSWGSDAKVLCFGFTDDTHITTHAGRATSGVEPMLHKIFGLKFRWDGAFDNQIASTPFINPDNIIVPRTTLTSAITEYTATENCAVFIELNADRNTSASIWIDNVQVGGTYSGAIDVYEDTLFLKKGQTIKMQSSLSGNYGSYAVYGLEAVSPISVSYPDIYTDYEREIGVWINGKPLYQKSIYIGDGGTNTTVEVPHGIANIDRVVDLRACFKNGQVLPTPNGGSDYIRLQSNDTNIRIVYGTNWSSYTSLYATIQYTKTTDQPGSGKYLPDGQHAHHYSTSEHIVGTWINGSTIYERTIQVNINANVNEGANLYRGSFSLSNYISNVKMAWIDIGMSYTGPDSGTRGLVSVWYETDDGSINYIVLYSKSNYPATFTVRYTKTT